MELVNRGSVAIPLVKVGSITIDVGEVGVGRLVIELKVSVAQVDGVRLLGGVVDGVNSQLEALTRLNGNALAVARNHVAGLYRKVGGHDVGGVILFGRCQEGRFQHGDAVGIQSDVRVVGDDDVLVTAVGPAFGGRGAREKDFADDETALGRECRDNHFQVVRSLAESYILGGYLKVLLSGYSVEGEVKVSCDNNVVGASLQIIAHDFIAIAIFYKLGAFNGGDLIGLDVGQRGDRIAEDSILQVSRDLQGNHRGGDYGNGVITAARC